MKYHFKVHKEAEGFWAECLELPGCFTQASTKEELFENMQEALNLYLLDPIDSTYLVNLPNAKLGKKPNVVQVPAAPEYARRHPGPIS